MSETPPRTPEPPPQLTSTTELLLSFHLLPPSTGRPSM